MKKHLFIPLFTLLLLALCACGTQEAEESTAVPTGPAGAEESTAVPTEPAEAVLDKVTMAAPPDKTVYLVGETFDPTGLVVNAVMSDGSVIENVEWTCEDITVMNRMVSVQVQAMGKNVTVPITVCFAGNVEEYSVASTQTVENSPVKGNTYFWLGSSVTFGAQSEEESMADFFAKKWDCTCIKEAVSGTKLTDAAADSYVYRLNQYLASGDRAEHLDGFICQLSTNDRSDPDGFGVVTEDSVTDPSSFDTKTTFGAMEYIIATARAEWDCPICFYTNPPMKDKNYEMMVEALERIAAKWDITIIDLYRDEDFNDISKEDYALYMADTIHPTRAGYREWWLPKFEAALGVQ